MKETLISKGFAYNGKCQCNPPKDIYKHPSFPGLQMQINEHNYWVKQQSRLLQTVSFGNVATFETDLNKYFPS